MWLGNEGLQMGMLALLKLRLLLMTRAWSHLMRIPAAGPLLQQPRHWMNL